MHSINHQLQHKLTLTSKDAIYASNKSTSLQQR
uniref:Protein translation factor SUI1 homolog 1 n=1 Tax=Rhizophora mucronata TaxID=61149 RepID=A0A2P2LMQ9_RHIMU